jgi:hypothetical protein
VSLGQRFLIGLSGLLGLLRLLLSLLCCLLLFELLSLSRLLLVKLLRLRIHSAYLLGQHPTGRLILLGDVHGAGRTRCDPSG